MRHVKLDYAWNSISVHICVRGACPRQMAWTPTPAPPFCEITNSVVVHTYIFVFLSGGGKIRRWWEKMLTDRKTYGFGDKLQYTLWESGNKLYSGRAYSFPACGFWHAPLAIVSCPLDRDRTSRIQTEIIWLIYRCHFKVIKSRIDTTYGTLFGIEKCKTLFWEIN